jgi:outer membrane murein-binding lipoprotein Lpp
MAAQAPAPTFDYHAMGGARCRANSAALLDADGQTSVADVSKCVAAELGLARLALGAAIGADGADGADAADEADARPAAPEAVPPWAAQITASVASLTTTVESLTSTVATLASNVASLTTDITSLTTDVTSLAKSFNTFELKTEARFANAQIDNMSQRLNWIPAPAGEPLPPSLPTTAAGVMALPRENIAVLLRLYRQRADSGWTEATLKRRICRYLGLADKLAPEK